MHPVLERSALRLAFLAPLVESVPPECYGGTERVVSWLVEELVQRGHEVTLFASGDSRTAASLVPGAPRALRAAGALEYGHWHLMMLGEAFRRARDFDLIHSHLDYLVFPFEQLIDTPVVHTLHGRLDLPWLPEIYERYPKLHLISISDAQRKPLPGVRFLGTVHHGLPPELFRFHPRAEDHLLFLGRISPEKGPLFAIEAAERAGVRLLIAAKVDPVDRAYFEQAVRPRLDPPRIEYVGEVNDREKEQLLGSARALLLPVDWPEPFGLTFIEALACGTPILTRPEGALTEIVREGVNGFAAADVGGLVRAIERIDRIDRAACRADFERRFTVERMASDYEALFRVVLAQAQSEELSRA